MWTNRCLTLFDSGSVIIDYITYMGYAHGKWLRRNTWAALDQAGFISKPGLRASHLVLIDLVQGRLNYIL